MTVGSAEKFIAELAEQTRARFYGKYRGVVVDVNDPEKRGRIRAQIPEVLGDAESSWALPCAPFTGDGMGQYTIPPVDAAVWIEFEAGDPARPIWVGGWWGDHQAPENQDGESGDPQVKTIRSESGLLVSMNDSSNELTVSDSNGSNILKLDVNGGKVTVQAATKVIVEAPQIELVENSSHPLVFGDELYQYLQTIVQIFQSHTHAGETCMGIPVTPAPPVPPMPTPQMSMLSQKVVTG